MMEKHDRLRQARIDAGYKTAAAAANALGITASTYRAHENGQNKFELEEAEVYGKRFNVSPLWLMTGSEPTEQPQKTNGIKPPIDSPNAKVLDRIVGDGRLIPVYGQAVGGVDGEFEMNGNILYEVMAPPVLSHVSNAYGVSIAGDSMSPRYEDGELAFVDPKRRVKKGDYVIAQIKTDEHGPLLAFVKKFIRHNAAELILEQFNPPKELRFEAESVVSVHYIALAGNGG
ncbi:helix-turn-helix transcriptional regulator [Rhizobium sp. CFBP 8762]|uniref:S24 family peptidase n=1 Tax=Rhizobium sp. CFBP 8762 TaxID=2775279 RepID=UPI0017875FB3|nr:helix-turn-helix transcriptional regulator [Rhizobium sp. CFBP 8762]MBD8556331.1 helix-turn-helix transcriptional regulator [Rhizobium sp. CFBP 8762]